MIVGVGFCPHPPALVPLLAGRAAPELADVLAAADAVVADLAVRSERIVVLGSGPRPVVHADRAWGTLAGFGVAVDAGVGPGRAGSPDLPLAATLGCWLLDRLPARPPTRVVSVASGGGPPDLAGIVTPGRVGLLVMADGSARHDEKAPGYRDERAAPFDELVAAALRQGDAPGLAGLDGTLGRQLLAAGTPVWRATGALLTAERPTGWVARLLYSGHPFGVGYHVAQWHRDIAMAPPP